ncbi:MAG: 2Fe-2S iron-sulfur cluster-binding protein [Candidatus Nanopelagicales bacterium]
MARTDRGSPAGHRSRSRATSRETRRGARTDEEYSLEALPTDRVLTILQRIKDEQDGTLTFRRSCAHGICGSDAMRINGRNRLACKTLIKDLNIKKPIVVEAIKGLPLEKDLVVDMEPFFAGLPGRDAVPVARRARAGQGAPAVCRGPGDLRRHHQVHPVRGLHHQSARCSGATGSTSARRRSWARTGSSSTPATPAPTCAWTS